LSEQLLSNDLNDLYDFPKIVERGSLSAAGAAVGVENPCPALGARLIQ
jgi:hypothetical protein